jgi:hypothetical protein
MEKIQPIAKSTFDKLDRWLPQIFMVFLFIILAGAVGWISEDRRAGHQELQTAAIVEKIYRRAVDDEMLVPLAEPTGGNRFKWHHDDNRYLYSSPIYYQISSRQ